jgi:hypothetical protein
MFEIDKSDEIGEIGEVGERKSSFVRSSSNITLFMLTWNVHGEDPISNDLSKLFPFDDFKNSNQEPDLIVVGLQESPVPICGDYKWQKELFNYMSDHSYDEIKSVCLRSLLLMLYAKHDKKSAFTSLESEYSRIEYTRTDLFGKKGLSVRTKYKGINICIVNSHFYPHEELLENRIKDYHGIVNSMKYRDPIALNILSHDFVLWMGDLNFRITDLTVDEIVNAASKRQYDLLIQHDQLTKAMQEGRIFMHFKEPVISFPPTYKFLVNTDNYDNSRKPSWTDRFLYHINPNNFHAKKLGVEILEYNSIPAYKISDHKPVKAFIKLIT